MTLRIRGIDSEECERIWRGGVDANGQLALTGIAQGATPCRHCLSLIPEGEYKLLLAYRPFAVAQPYAEMGPIFLHPQPCEQYNSTGVPPWFDYLDPALVRGYGHDHWIRYETAQVIAGKEITQACTQILSDASIAYVHVRSKYNCFQCRVDRE